MLYLQATRDKLVGQRSVDEVVNVRPDTTVVEVDAPHLVLQTEAETAWRAIRRWLSSVVSG